MKFLRIASKAIFLVILPTLVASAQPAYNPLQPQGGTYALPGPPASASAPAPSTAESSAPGPTTLLVKPHWWDSLFSQKLPIDFGFKVAGIHSDNIFFQNDKSEDYFTELTPSMVLTLGQPIVLYPQLDQETIYDDQNDAHLNFVQITYRPVLRLFDEHEKLDDVDQYADAIFSHQFSRLTLSVEQTYEKLSQPTVQVNTPGTLVNRDVFTTLAKANYIYSDQLSTYSTFSQTVTTYIGNEYTDNTEWFGDYYFLYQLSPKLSLGLGPRIGFDDVDQAPNQSFQDGLVHLYYAVTGKFTIEGSAGAELREFEHDSSPERVTPLIEAKAIYQPFDSMTFTLYGERHRIVANGTIGRDYDASIGTLELKQRLLQVVYVTLSGQYEDDEYTSFENDGGPAREDGIYYLKGGLEWASFRGLTIDAGYTYLRDDSNIKAFSFNESRATISASFTY
jgi:hypothetical protein